MDIEKLIERLRNNNIENNCHDCALGYYAFEAATALSTLQAENARLRAELEYERKHANAYYEECGQWEAENEKLRAEVESFKKGHCAGCSIPAVKAEQIRDLTDAPKLRAELEQVKRERDAARSDIETALAYGMKDCELCKNSQCYVRGGTKPCLPKWRGQKED